MNENIDLTKILKNCPKDFELYTTIFGYVKFKMIIAHSPYPIRVYYEEEINEKSFTIDGKMVKNYDAECTLFPSKDQRNWREFAAPWYKKEKFDPKTLKAFDKVIARIDKQGIWCCELFSFIEENTDFIKGFGAYYKYCIPYNDDTRHLVGTKDEAPDFYRYWED